MKERRKIEICDLSVRPSRLKLTMMLCLWVLGQGTGLVGYMPRQGPYPRVQTAFYSIKLGMTHAG